MRHYKYFLKGILLLGLLILDFGIVQAQLDSLMMVEPKKEDREKLKKLIQANRTNRSLAINEYLKRQKNAGKSLKFLDTTNIEGIRLDGRIIFTSPDNLTARNTVGVPSLQDNVSLGLNLFGSNYRIGIWEAGSEGRALPRSTHENFTNLIWKDTGSSSNHATHVAGTLVGNGSGNANAEGMASGARLLAYDSSNDTEEMMIEAEISNNFRISNHSYGTITGWRCIPNATNTACSRYDWEGVGTDQNASDPLFGLYNNKAEAWDQLALVENRFLIVKSAGNDRLDRPINGISTISFDGGANTQIYNSSVHPPADNAHFSGGYRTIPTYGNAKNILTVGAINGSSSNAMTNFSSWGPTQDGRVKPDIVAHGNNVLSSTAGSDSEYSRSFGTSMASPNAAGSALLISELFDDLIQKTNSALDRFRFLPNFALKALLIHTATDLGRNGPDYIFGWGLLNVEAAAKLLIDISDKKKGSLFVNSFNTNSAGDRLFRVTSNGCEPLKFTLVYNDRPGIAQTGFSTSSRLVNDLDMEVARIQSATIWLPFVLNPNNPAAVATTGDNDRDNVKQIVIENPAAGYYNIIIKADGPINGLSQFALIVSGNEGGNVNSYGPSLSPLGVLNINHGFNGILTLEDLNGGDAGEIQGKSIPNDGRGPLEITALDKIIIKPHILTNVTTGKAVFRLLDSENCPN